MTTNRQIREYVAANKNADRVRVAKNGEVHALGTMPNTNKRGWFFAGFVETIRDEIEQKERDARGTAEAAAQYNAAFTR